MSTRPETRRGLSGDSCPDEGPTPIVPPGRAARVGPTARSGRTGLRRVCVAALLALCTVSLALPTARAESEEPTEPADYAVAEEAEEITGTASSGDSPTLAEPGYFTDTIGRGETKYYRLDLDATSTAYVSALAHPKVGNKVSVGDRLDVRMESMDGKTCSTDRASFNGADAPYPIAALASRRIGGDSDICQSADHYLVRVSRDARPSADPGDWPLELHYQLEPGLKGSLPAPPVEGSWNTEPPSLPTGEAGQVRGGSGLRSAPSISDGAWNDRVLPGETRFYRVPVDFGQQLFARAQLPNADRIDEDAPTRTVFDGFGLHVFSPTGASIVQDNFQSYDGGQNAAAFGLRPVEYGNRFDSRGMAISTAGFYTLAVTLDPNLEQFFPNGAKVTLRVRLRGEVKEPPEYVEDARAAGFGLNDQDKAIAKEGGGDEETGGRGTLGLVGVFSVATGVALVLLLAAWIFLARRRARGGTVEGSTGPTTSPGGVPSGAGGSQQAPGGWR